VIVGQPGVADDRLGRQLVLDEVFDLSLYRALRDVATGSLRGVLDELIVVETRHVAFWQEFFGLKDVTRLDPARRLKLATLIMTCRLFGSPAIHIVLEAIEVHGIRKYLRVWNRYKDGPLGSAVRGILEDEFKHEDMVVTGDAEASSEAEVRATEDERRRFLGATVPSQAAEGPMASALVVGFGYLAGAVVPVLPVLFGATGLLPTVLTAGAMIVAVSAIVAFISGMAVRRRIVLNLIITGIAVVVTYAIGLLAKAVWGITA